ncbi:MAG: hypothetical protein ACU0DW_15495 [Shimia sp.]
MARKSALGAGLLTFLSLHPTLTFAQTLPLPESCTPYVTIQLANCTVVHHYRCGAEADERWRVDMDQDGPFFANHTDAEGQWIESFDLYAGIVDRLDEGSADPLSFTELTRTDRDDFDFTTTSDTGETIRYRGRDRLTGRTVVIDDIPLLETETFARSTGADGKLLWESTGNEYIHLDWRIFISGQYLTRTPNETVPEDNRPIAFALPGEAGFLSDTPEYNCNTEFL